MEFNKKQKKIINFKPHEHLLVKGEKFTGKTTAIINKIPSLLNQYCIDKDDKVLIAAQDEEHSKHLSLVYDNIESEKYHQNSFFDEDKSDKLEINTIDSLMLYYFDKYAVIHSKTLSLASEEECEIQLKNSIAVVGKKHEKEKFNLIDVKFLKVIKEEIAWIKSCNYISLEEYKNSNRIGLINKLEDGMRILRKNSKQRQAIYEVLIQYNKNLENINKIDSKDIDLYALKMAKKDKSKNYTHIIIDNAESLTKVQLEFLKELHNNKHYSSIIFGINTDSDVISNAWLIKGRSFSSLGFDMKGKSVTLKAHFKVEIDESITETLEVIKSDIVKEKEVKSNSFELGTLEYIDLKKNISHKFIKDPDAFDEIYIEDDGLEEKADEIVNIPLFNEIAAGSPILINDSIEENYSLPKDWIRNPKNVFMLKVKGDSMINKNIYDGDYVVINKQSVPNLKDVVAVDIEGEATLKTYKVIDGKITLTPENEKYDPIIIEDQQFSFLGVAIGLVKNY